MQTGEIMVPFVIISLEEEMLNTVGYILLPPQTSCIPSSIELPLLHSADQGQNQRRSDISTVRIGR